MAKLNEYLDARDESLTAFARRIREPIPSVHAWSHGTRIPKPDTMRKIVVGTKGGVMPNDFYDIPPEYLRGRRRANV